MPGFLSSSVRLEADEHHGVCPLPFFFSFFVCEIDSMNALVAMLLQGVYGSLAPSFLSLFLSSQVETS